MRKKLFFSVIILIGLLTWIGLREYGNEYQFRFGNLLFNSNKVDWGIIELNKSYSYHLKVYNPTEKDIFLKVAVSPKEFEILKRDKQDSNWINQGFCIHKKSKDTLIFNFLPTDFQLIGSYSKEIYFEVDHEEIFEHLLMQANIVENFSNENPNPPKIKAPITVYDFTNMPLRDLVCTSFLIKNVGKSNLIIRKIETTCGCTGAMSNKRIIPPNDSTTIDIAFHSLNNSGYQNKTINLYCNDPKNPIIKFTIKGFVLNE